MLAVIIYIIDVKILLRLIPLFRKKRFVVDIDQGIHKGLTEVAGEGGPDLAPQKFLSSQKFRHLMR